MPTKIRISFSGGRTSAYMTKRVLDQARQADVEVVVLFANTGCEHPATLDFIRDCDRYFDFKTVWMEAVIDPRHRKGVRPRVVTYDTASRGGEPFEAYIKKHGIPNRSNPQCTSRLKTEVMDHYTKHVIGWKHYVTAIGIRADEADRMSSTAVARGLWYPLVQWDVTKNDVLRETARWPFRLALPGDHYGNCVWCWKKSNRKLATLAQENPRVFDFPARMEKLYSGVRAEFGARRFFRGERTVDDIKAEALWGEFIPYSDGARPEWNPDLDVGGACGESCEIGADD